VTGSCEHGNDPASFVEGGEFLDWLGECWLLGRDSPPSSWLVGWLVGTVNYCEQ
jgi:hypothetical protein